MSRNKREGVYAGRIKGQHFRAHNPPTVVLEGDEILFTYPVPSGPCAFGAYIRRRYPATPKQHTPQQVKDAYRALHWEDEGEKKSPAP